jgi:dTDP-4-amino-4,6-dideoxygalactose transaminase
VNYKGTPLVSYGDVSVLRFHATKLFTTIEGGALVSGSDEQRRKVNLLKNFGIAGEEIVAGPGINGKMNEFQAAFGLTQFRRLKEEITGRAAIAALYREGLKDVPGITVFDEDPNTQPTNGYFPILVRGDQFGMTRDELFGILRKCNIIARKYFYPLISHATCYARLPSAAPAELPIAEQAAREVLCLPIYAALDHGVVRHICSAIAESYRSSRVSVGVEVRVGAL